jgi:hypothetical protein
MKKRPWLWIVFAYCIFIALTISFVVIATKNKQADVPLKPIAQGR